MMILVLIWFIIILIALVLYLLQAFGLYGMGENAGGEYNWLAFVPPLHTYVIGQILREIKIDKYTLPYPEIILPSSLFACSFFSYLGIIGNVLLLCVFFLYVISFYQLYALYRKNAPLFYIRYLVSLFPS